MSAYDMYREELEALRRGEGRYEWDELEELITDGWDEGKLTSDEFDGLMRLLMDIEL